MGKRLIKDSTLAGIAEAIRGKDGNASPMTPLEMAGRIAGIPTGEGGVDLPELATPAGSSEVLKGYQAINQAGAVVNGSHVCPTVADLTQDANAGASDIMNGKTAYVNGQKVTGSHVCPDVLDTSDATATPEQVAEGVTYYAQGEKKTGSAKVVDTARNEFGTLSSGDGRITLGTDFSEPTLFPAGSKHNVRANLSNFGDATAADVASGKTFTSASGLKVEGSYVAQTLASQTQATAAAGDIMSGKTAWVNGEKLTGSYVAPTADPYTVKKTYTMKNQSTCTVSLSNKNEALRFHCTDGHIITLPAWFLMTKEDTAKSSGFFVFKTTSTSYYVQVMYNSSDDALRITCKENSALGSSVVIDNACTEIQVVVKS